MRLRFWGKRSAEPVGSDAVEGRVVRRGGPARRSRPKRGKVEGQVVLLRTLMNHTPITRAAKLLGLSRQTASNRANGLAEGGYLVPLGRNAGYELTDAARSFLEWWAETGGRPPMRHEHAGIAYPVVRWTDKPVKPVKVIQMQNWVKEIYLLNFGGVPTTFLRHRSSSYDDALFYSGPVYARDGDEAKRLSAESCLRQAKAVTSEFGADLDLERPREHGKGEWVNLGRNRLAEAIVGKFGVVRCAEGQADGSEDDEIDYYTPEDAAEAIGAPRKLRAHAQKLEEHDASIAKMKEAVSSIGEVRAEVKAQTEAVTALAVEVKRNSSAVADLASSIRGLLGAGRDSDQKPDQSAPVRPDDGRRYA